MKTSDNRFETGVFHDRHDAEQAVKLLHELGYRDDEISVVMSDRTKAREFAEDTGSKAAEGATTGGVIGGAIGAIIAGFTATGAIVTIAGTGGLAAPIVLGPLAAILAGMGAGGLAGGIIGGLIGAGIPEDRAREIASDVERGGIAIAVRPHAENRERVDEILGGRGRVRTESGDISASQPAYADVPPRRNV
ncbi:MAG TPA: general stress protein [Candidatus Acidoferrales bacterium]|nr:general stress protein [Candidatus Acidoferrales bacterium]